MAAVIINTERSHIFEPHNGIVLKLTIVPEPSVSALKLAIKKAVQAHEILGCRVVLSQDGTATYDRISASVYAIKLTDDDWMQTLRIQEKIPFDFVSGELVRFFITPKRGCIELLIFAHHLAGDGLSVAILAQDIMAGLSGEEPAFRPMRLLEVRDLPSKSFRGFLAADGIINRANRKWQKDGRVFGYRDYLDMFRAYWENRSSRVFCDTVTAAEYEALRAFGKKNGLTLNSVLTTALLEAHGKKADTGLAVSVRRPNDKSMGNFASGIAIQYAYAPGVSFAENARRVQKKIYRRLSRPGRKYFVLHVMNATDGTLLDAMHMAVYGGFENPIAKKMAAAFGFEHDQKDLSLSNLGCPIKSEYGAHGISHMAFAAPVIPSAKRVMGAVTVGQSLCLSMHVMDGPNVDCEFEQFKKTVSRLRSLGNS